MTILSNLLSLRDDQWFKKYEAVQILFLNTLVDSIVNMEYFYIIMVIIFVAQTMNKLNLSRKFLLVFKFEGTVTDNLCEHLWRELET